jgi:hypothetical protein
MRAQGASMPNGGVLQISTALTTRLADLFLLETIR